MDFIWVLQVSNKFEAIANIRTNSRNYAAFHRRHGNVISVAFSVSMFLNLFFDQYMLNDFVSCIRIVEFGQSFSFSLSIYNNAVSTCTHIIIITSLSRINTLLKSLASFATPSRSLSPTKWKDVVTFE